MAKNGTVYIYKSALKVIRFYDKCIRGTQIIGKENLIEPPYIVVSNHSSLFDPLFVASSIQKPVRFMAKKELFSDKTVIHKVFKNFLLFSGAFPVDREKLEIATIKKTKELLRDAEVVGMFPEGTRNTTDELIKNFKEGAVYFAMQFGVPILPVARLLKSKDLKYARNITIIGESINYEKPARNDFPKVVKEKTEELEKTFIKLLSR